MVLRNYNNINFMKKRNYLCISPCSMDLYTAFVLRNRLCNHRCYQSHMKSKIRYILHLLYFNSLKYCIFRKEYLQYDVYNYTIIQLCIQIIVNSHSSYQHYIFSYKCRLLLYMSIQVIPILFGLYMIM